MRMLGASVVLASLLVGLAFSRTRHDADPGAPRVAYERVCGAHSEVEAERRAVLATLVQELDGSRTSNGRGARVDVDRARREALGQRLEGLRAEVEAAFADAREQAEEVVTARALDAPSGALERVRAASLRWIDPRAPGARDAGALHRGCGSDLLVDDAWVDKSGSRVVLCPGLLLVAAARGEIRDGLAFLIAHELGHVIVGARASDEQAERVAESEADRWGARILASMIDDVRGTRAEEAFVRAALEPLCTPKGDATHASGPERVRAIARELSGARERSS